MTEGNSSTVYVTSAAINSKEDQIAPVLTFAYHAQIQSGETELKFTVITTQTQDFMLHGLT